MKQHLEIRNGIGLGGAQIASQQHELVEWGVQDWTRAFQWTNGPTGRFVSVVLWNNIKKSGGGFQTVEISGHSLDCNRLFPASEAYGSNLSMTGDCYCNGTTHRSVNTRTGNEHFKLPGVSVAGRGPGLSFQIGYNSLDADYDGPVGNGWRHSYDMQLVTNTDGSRTVVQETGATVTFHPDGSGGWAAPQRMEARLAVDGTEFVFERNHFEFFRFNSAGQLIEISDRNGYTTTLVYGGSGELDYVQDEATRTLDFEWVNGRVDTITDPRAEGAGRTIAFDYDPSGSGDLVGYTDIGGGEWALGYDAQHRLTSVLPPRFTDPAKVFEYHYDAQGRVDWEEDPMGRRTWIHYDDPVPGATRVVDPDGDARVDWYNLYGQRTKITNGYGTTDVTEVVFEYDPDTFMVEKMIDGNGHEWIYGYDDPANPRSRTSIVPPGPLGSVTTTYNGFGQPLTITDGEGVATEYGYDADGNVEYVTAGKNTPVETTTDFVYGDPVNYPGDVTAVVDGRGKTWATTYDPSTGYRKSATDPEGNKSTWEYTSLGWVDHVTAPKGNVVNGTPENYRTHFTYTDHGDVATVTNPADEVVTRTYDAHRNVLTVTDNDNETTTYHYDDADQLDYVTRPDSTVIDYDYWPDGMRKSWTSGTGGVWQDTYDSLDRLKTRTDPNGETYTYGYDANGNLTSVEEPYGDCEYPYMCVLYEYWPGDLLKKVLYSDSGTPDISEVLYDGVGRRVSRSLTTYGSGSSTDTWEYDELGRLKNTTDLSGRITRYTWDAASNLTTILYPDETTPVTYGYDNASRATSVTDWLGNVTLFDPDENGNYETVTFPTATGNVDSFEYDTADRMTSATWQQNSTVLGSVDYDPRDPEGLLAQADSTGLPGADETYGYDDLDRLTNVNATTALYDAAGNLTKRFDGTNQAFDPAQQLCWTGSGTGTCAAPPAGATTYGYDEHGNRTSMTPPDQVTATQYRYDQAHRLESIDAVSGASVQIGGMTGIPLAGDFDGDAFDDVFFYRAGGPNDDYVFFGEERVDFGKAVNEYHVGGTYVPRVGDFDGDGHDDILWYKPGTSADYIWFWYGRGDGDYDSVATEVNGTTYDPVVGDFDGDGFDDIFWYNPGSASDYIWWGAANVDDGAAFAQHSPSVNGASYEPFAGDFDGNGIDDIFWYSPGGGADFVWWYSSTRGSYSSASRTLNGTYDPFVGDFDGDGKDDALLYGPGSGGDFLWWGSASRSNFNSSNEKVLTMDSSLYEPAAGDFDGDGKDDALLYRPGAHSDSMYWGTSRSNFGTNSAHIGLANQNARSWDYAYDGDGLRIEKTNNLGDETTFVWSAHGGLPLLLSETVNGVESQIVYGPDGQPLSQITGTTVNWYHHDQLGSTRLVTDQTGATVGTYAYDPYGALATSTGSFDPILDFAGQYTDDETGFQYLRARHYDPETGQFLTRDPLVHVTQEP